MGTARARRTDQMLIFGERHLRSVLAGYEARDNGTTPPQPPVVAAPTRSPHRPPSQERVKRQPVLGSLINEYQRAA